jgi:Predicted hydrolase of the metallo-beta-lactamase superfamily
MTEAVRPKYVVPIHGEYRMLFRHKEFVKNHLGYPEENIILIENGDVLELDGERAAVIDKKEIGRTFIDESGFEEIASETVRQRKQLAYEGAVTVVVSIDEETGEIVGEPQIVARGVRGLTSTNGFTPIGNAVPTVTTDNNYLLGDAKRVIAAALSGASRQTLAEDALLKEHLRVELKRFIQKRTGARPVITFVIVKA